MSGVIGGAFVALWLGVLTSISPCPLATNIAAISFIGRRVERPGVVLASGLLYTLGRAAAYTVLAAVIVAGLLAIPAVSTFLQRYMHLLLGPILILVGMFLLELLGFKGNLSTGMENGVQKRADRLGVWGALLMGIVFALSFCPTSAALFFGSLVPLAVEHHSWLVLPVLYGTGTALPVVLFALLLALATHQVARVYGALTRVEVWMRRGTGVVFIIIGVYYTVRYVLLAP